MRALLDFQPPYGIRELAARARVPIGSLSRTVDLLDRDGLITKDGRGPITDLNWEGVIRRWAKDYDVTSTNQVNTFLEPRGLPALSTKLGKLKRGYAVTGAFGAQRFSPIAPTPSQRSTSTMSSVGRNGSTYAPPRAARTSGFSSRTTTWSSIEQRAVTVPSALARPSSPSTSSQAPAEIRRKATSSLHG